MKITVMHIGASITEMTIESWNGTTVIEDVSNLDGTIDAERILERMEVALKTVEREDFENPYKSGAAKIIVDTLLQKESWIKKPKILWDD